MTTLHAVGNWWYHFLGLKGMGAWYAWWSAGGSDWGQLPILVGVIVGVRKLNCHTKGCWRIGHHEAAGGVYKLCRRHHPDVPDKGASHAHILAAHREAKERQVS